VSITVLRNSPYYARHYIFILFLMTTSVFITFTVPTENIDARSNIVFSLLLTVVAFNYSCSETIPKVPYATILELYINACFLTVLAAGVVCFFFSWLFFYDQMTCGDDDSANNACHQLSYDPFIESWIGFFTFVLWTGCNVWYWGKLYEKEKLIKQRIKEDQQIDWLQFKTRKNSRADSASTRASTNVAVASKPKPKGPIKKGSGKEAGGAAASGAREGVEMTRNHASRKAVFSVDGVTNPLSYSEKDSAI